MLSLCLVIQRDIPVTHFGFCLSVIVNEKPLSVEKTTSSVLSVCLFIYVSNYQLCGIKYTKFEILKVYTIRLQSERDEKITFI